MAEQPNDNYARHDHLHDDVYTPIPTFEDHANDQLKHGGSMVPDYSTSARRAIPIDTMSRITPFAAPDNGIAVGNFAPPAGGMIIYAYINGIRTSFQSSASQDLGHNRDCLTIPLKKGDTLWFGDADGNSKQAGYLDGVYYPHWFYPYVHTVSNLTGDVELHLGSHTGVHKAEATGDVTTTDPSKTVTVVKSNNTMAMQQTIDGVPVDLTDPATTPPSSSGYVDIGALRIIYGMTPVIPRANSYNQIVRIKLPQSVSTLLSVTTTIVMTGNNYDGSQLRAHDGPECSAQVMRVIDDYMYVFLDGHVSGVHPEVAISYNIFTTK